MAHMSNTPNISGLGQVALTVSNLNRSIAFYKDVVGLPFLFQAGPTLAFFKCGHTRLMLGMPENDFKPGSSTALYFKVDDIHSAVAALEANGVTFSDEFKPHLIAKMADHDLWMCFFYDPDQHLLALMAEMPQNI